MTAPNAHNLATAIAFAKANRKSKAIYVTKWGYGRIGYQLERMGIADSWSPPHDMNTRRDRWARIDRELWYMNKKAKQTRSIQIMGIYVKVIND